MKRIIPALLTMLCPWMMAKAAVLPPGGDSLSWYRAVTQIGKLYQQKPVQLAVAIRRVSTPLLRSADSNRAELSLYLGEHDYYLSADGLEMILNDSLSLLVNHPGHRMMLYEKRQSVNQQLPDLLTAFAADSSVAQLAKQYEASHELLAGQREKIRLASREQVPGTGLPRQSVWLIRNTGSADPVAYGTQKTRLLPVDSTVWSGWQKDTAYAGKLVRYPGKSNGWMYFLAREETTVYEFISIRRGVQKPPVTLTDRLQQGSGGQYLPAKGYEGYLFTKEE